MYSKTLFLHIFQLTLLASSALGAITRLPEHTDQVSKPEPYVYKQTTKAEHKKASGARRAVPSNVPGPADVSPTTDDTTTYYFFHIGQGAIETDDNPGNDVEFLPPLSTLIPGSQDREEAVQSCADFSWDQGYFAFQIYYRRSTNEWTCRCYIYAFPGDQSDSSYFNVVDEDVLLAYGYQQRVE
uniref:Uncharacterized protein n=1 Tax=Kwoniella bestiolae CBS 10118 TaxID=1296100 RepID=A0A1B9G3W8_9TREE|nr:hypothetical protein I302_03398 [Kwoniella bestiolae CBS 10118]OCF25725.1 hypothetical protein I302_03398 [Kwoniella bestiolae CBS 10118]